VIRPTLRHAVVVVVSAAILAAGATSADAATRAPSTAASASVPHVATTPIALSAFPADGSVKGMQANLCQAWTTRLQSDQAPTLEVEGQETNSSSTAQLEADKDKALDDGCVVID
jgi:curli biogenesis system outer membrane secretion channel CsgG